MDHGECPICQGTGFAVHARGDGVLTAARCGCAAREREAALLRCASIPPRYEHCTLDSFEPQNESHAAALEVARAWIERWPAVEKGLLIVGPPGTGKTHLAVGIARELIREKGAQLLFCEQRSLFKAMQGTYDSAAAQRESEILRPALDAEVLLLDDLGAGRTTPWTADVMHDVIAHRYNAQRTMLLTTNCEPDDEGQDRAAAKRSLHEPLRLRDRIGDALLSRLYEMCQNVKLRGDDYRSRILHHRDQI